MFQSIRWRIAMPYMMLILLTMVGLAIYLSGLVRDSYLSDLEAKLTAEAELIADAVGTANAWEEPDGEFDAWAQHYADLLDARVTFIDAEGLVLGDSHAERSQMDNHLRRPEVQSSLKDEQGISMRMSRTMNYEMMYAAVPVRTERGLQGFVRVALPLRQVEANVARLRRVIIMVALLTSGGAAILALFLAERIARPIRQLTNVVRRMTTGDLNARLIASTQDEIGELAQAFNQMASQLQGTIDSLGEERSRLAAVMENMADGVLITDARGLVRLINPAAARLLDTDEEQALGRSFAQVTRDHRIIKLWRRCHRKRKEQVEPIEMDRRDAFFQVVVTPLNGSESQACLIILQDLTRVRRLETVRRDFISNISHELRTPMASLKALVDTLRDGALDDPPAAQRFLDRMEVEVDALTQMVHELLELSRIESGRAPIRLGPVTVAEVVIPAVERLRPQAERADLHLIADVPPGLPLILADAERAQQVVTNLVHNAIKFTPAGGEVLVSGSRVHVSEDGTIQPATLNLEPEALPPGDWVVISVADTGVGIPPEDLPRIFERFYKADRARSGGGTGLGLAIAKHIVQAHKGHIWAESPATTQGSTFFVAIPALTSR